MPAIVEVGELFVVEAHQVKDGGVKVIDADTVDGGPVPEFIRGAMMDPAPNPAPGHPVRERVGVVIPARLSPLL